MPTPNLIYCTPQGEMREEPRLQALAFGNQAVGTTSTPQKVTLNNAGASKLYLTSISISGVNPQDFAQTNTCGKSIGAGASCTISVTFTPMATGARSASVSIADNGGGSPQALALTGTGT